MLALWQDNPSRKDIMKRILLASLFLLGCADSDDKPKTILEVKTDTVTKVDTVTKIDTVTKVDTAKRHGDRD